MSVDVTILLNDGRSRCFSDYQGQRTAGAIMDFGVSRVPGAYVKRVGSDAKSIPLDAFLEEKVREGIC